MEFFHPLFLSWLEFLKVAFWALFFFWFSSMISPTLWKILHISLLMTPPSAVPCHPSYRQAAASLCSADLDKITIWSNTWNMSFNPNKSHTPTMFLRKDRLEPPTSTFSTILLKKSFHSSFCVSLPAMIFPGKATFPSWPPKPVTDWHPTSCKVLPWHT